MAERLIRTLIIHPGSKSYSVIVRFDEDEEETIPVGWERTNSTEEELKAENYTFMPFAGILLG